MLNFDSHVNSNSQYANVAIAVSARESRGSFTSLNKDFGHLGMDMRKFSVTDSDAEENSMCRTHSSLHKPPTVGRQIASSNSAVDVGLPPRAQTSLFNKSKTLPSLGNGHAESHDSQQQNTSSSINSSSHNKDIVDRLRGSQKMVSGAQFRSAIKEPVTCEQCEIYQRGLAKSKDTIRTLKFQITRLEDTMKTLTMSKKTSDFSPRVLREALDQHDAAKEKETLLRRIKELEIELDSRLRRNTDELLLKEETIKRLQDSNINLQKDLSEISTRLVKITNDMQTSEGNNLHLRRHISCLEEDLSGVKRSAGESQALSDQLYTDNQQKIATLEDTVASLRSTLFTSEGKNKDLESLVENLKMQLINKSEEFDKIQNNKQKDNSFTQQLQNQIKGIQIEIERLKEIERNLTVTNTLLNDSMIAKVSENITLKSDKDNLRKELETLNKRFLDLTARMTRESENTATVLQKALSSSIRVCVVAPTVNVHAGDKKLKFKSGLQETRLQDFLVNDVLRKHTYLFEQPSEDSGPDGSPLQPWVQRVLQEMQRSIDHHINSSSE